MIIFLGWPVEPVAPVEPVGIRKTSNFIRLRLNTRQLAAGSFIFFGQTGKRANRLNLNLANILMRFTI